MQHTTRTILVTGSTDGIGKQTAMDLARLGARVILHGRKAERLERTRRDFAEAGLDTAGTLVADFADLTSVREMAREAVERYPDLNILVNNAGLIVKRRAVTGDGHETTWQVNHLAPVLLTMELLPLLRKNVPARIVNVSSVAHTRGRIDLEDLNGERAFDSYGAYAQSKLANVLFTYELAEQLAGASVDVNCLHPGVIGTKLLMAGFGIDGASLEEGARTSVHLAMSEDLEGVSGKYFVQGETTPSSAMTYDVRLRKDLWDLTMQAIGNIQAKQ
jgi:NAD(P)-dependent dehydrogenase (short-subunit alcohol dehydrogenase family)